MNKETKDKLKDVAADAAKDATEWLKQEAKASTGLMRWVWGILALLGMGVCVWLSSCNGVTPDPAFAAGSYGVARQVQALHGVYHAVSGEPCVFVVENLKK